MQRNDKLLHGIGKAQHRSNQAERCHNAAAGYARGCYHGDAQHHNKGGEQRKGRVHAAGKHNAHRAEDQTDRVAVQVDGCAQRDDKVRNIAVDPVIIGALERDRDGGRTGLRAERGKVCRYDVFDALHVVLSAYSTCQRKLRQDIQHLQHKDNEEQGGEHLDGGKQAALRCNITEQACNVHRDQRDDDARQHTGDDFLQIAEDIQQGGAAQVGHADAEYKCEHQRGHYAENGVNSNGEKRFKRIAFQDIAGDRLDQRGQGSTADEEGQETGYDRRAVSQQQRQPKQAVCLLAEFRHAHRDKRQDNERDHEGQEGGKQRCERCKQADDGDKAGGIGNAEPAAGKADECASNNANN